MGRTRWARKLGPALIARVLARSTPRVTRRLNRVIGQLNGIKGMVEQDRYCKDVLTQLAAAESAVQAISRLLLKEHLETCVVEQIQEGNIEVVDEVMDLLKKFGA